MDHHILQKAHCFQGMVYFVKWCYRELYNNSKLFSLLLYSEQERADKQVSWGMLYNINRRWKECMFSIKKNDQSLDLKLIASACLKEKV